MSSDTTDLIAVDALGPDGEYRIRNREPVTATDGVVVAELTLAPPLYVSRAIKAQRAVRPLPAHEREAALAKAADIFANGVLAGLDFDAYTALASRISGVPISVTRAGARAVADGVASAFARRSAGPAVGCGAGLARRTRGRRGLGPPRRRVRGARIRQWPGGAWAVAAGLGAGLPGRGPPVAA